MELRGIRHAGVARALTPFWVALAGVTLLRLAIAASAPLAPDEAYYWVWSRALAWGYPDHPPMVALWIRLGTAIAGDGTLGVRLFGPLSVAIGSLLLVDAGNRLFPAQHAGLRAAVLLNATLLVGAGSVIMTPDAPLLVFWTACLWALARLTQDGRWQWWPLAGLFAGLAMLSKYTAALLWFGIALWPLLTPTLRPWLRRPAPWCGGAIAVALCLPVVLWNAQHDWVSFLRQGGRVGAWHPADAPRFVGELLLGQIGLLTPLVAAFCTAGIIVAAQQAWRTRAPAWTLLAALSLPSVLLFIQHALGDRVQGNWPAIIYPAATLAAASLQTPVWRRLYPPAIVLGFGITLLVYLQTLLPLPLPVRLDPIARQLDGWDTLAAQVDDVRRRQGAAFVAADQYGVAAELARELPAGVTVIGAEPRWELFTLPRANLGGQPGILVRSARRAPPNTADWLSIVPSGHAQRSRGTQMIEDYRLYRVAPSGESTVLPPRADGS